MEKEIKIDLVPKEQINEDFDCVRITCENICVWANCLESAIKAFDEAIECKRLLEDICRKLEDGVTRGNIIDINGNKVGQWSR